MATAYPAAMTEQIDNIQAVLLASLTSFASTILGFLPNVLAALVVLALGLFLARIAKIVVERLLRLLNFDSLVKRTGLESLVEGTEYNLTISGVISLTVYWLVILLMVTSIADLLRFQIIYELFERFVIYLPNILVALAILVFGSIFARIVNRYAFSKCKGLSMDAGLRVGIIAEDIVLIIVWFLALQQLHVNVDLLLLIIGISLGSAGLAAGIAFGLAGRRHAARILTRVEKRFEQGIED